MRILIDRDPYTSIDRDHPWQTRGHWPCRWIACPGAGEPPFVTAFRRWFSMERSETVRVHVSADERYELFLDGRRVGRGPERGDGENWFYESYDLQMDAGPHVLAARVWSLGDRAPYAQHTVIPGFILAPEEKFIDLMGTGVAAWEAKVLDGIEFGGPQVTGPNITIDAAKFPWGFEKGEGDGWQPVKPLHEGLAAGIANEIPPGHRLRPAILPAMLDQTVATGMVRLVSELPVPEPRRVPFRASDHRTAEAPDWDLVKGKKSITVPPRTRRRVLIDLENYYCAYPELVTSGGKGSTIYVDWAEALFVTPDRNDKGNRNEIEGKFFRNDVEGLFLRSDCADVFKPDGDKRRSFRTPWWKSGRYIELQVVTGDEPLTIDRFTLHETRYPLEMESRFESSDVRLDGVIPIAVRGLQMCSHETYMDCPYYEQLMYVGDTRLEALTTYAITRDDRLPRKALQMFDASRLNWGLTQSRYPSRIRQIIPPFSLWWIGMIHDFALWRGDREYVRRMLPGVRNVLDGYRAFTNSAGLIQAPNGWNFMDWVPGWNAGIPPVGEFGTCGIINWHWVYTLALTAELEDWAGEPEPAARWRRLAMEYAQRIKATFWDDKRNLFADDPYKKHFSEHAQCLAILSGQLDPGTQNQVGRALVAEPNLSRTTIYFTHYLFETYRVLGNIDALFDRLGLWFGLEKHGFKTTFESPEPSRSDCHAWGAHPVYHYFATILGIRPGRMGFDTVTVEPQLGPLKNAKATLVHPKGTIELDLRSENGKINGTVTLPETIRGTFKFQNKRIDLSGGKTDIRIP